MENNKTYDELYKVIDDILFDFVTYRKKKNHENEMKNYYELEKKYNEEGCDNLIEKNKQEENIYQKFYNNEEKNSCKLNNYSDIDYMEHILTELNKRIYTHIVYTLDEYEYEGSPIYNNILDKEFIAQLIDKVIDRLIKDIKEIEEITKEVVKDNLCRLKLLRSIVEICIVCELFSFRRPHYRKYNILNLE